MTQEISKLLNLLGTQPFKPLSWLQQAKLQTIISHYLPYSNSLSHQNQHIVPLVDGDKIVLVENQPLTPNSTNRMILLVHGLTGSHLSTHILRLANKFIAVGYTVFRMNLRGCGAGAGLAKKIYHSGRSEDTRAILHWLKERYPHSPITQIGLSLGGNISLKMAGEDGPRRSGNLDSVIAISPPLDLLESVKLIMQKSNRVFNNHFVTRLIKEIKTLHGLFPDLPPIPTKLFQIRTLYDFDDLYTAPSSGFKDAEDYYAQCSSKHFIEHIHYPTLVLYALDDPVVSPHSYSSLPHKTNLDLITTEKGGHVGWLGRTKQPFDYHWMDQVVINWVKKLSF